MVNNEANTQSSFTSYSGNSVHTRTVPMEAVYEIYISVSYVV